MAEVSKITMGKRTNRRGRGFGNAAPVTGLEAAADLVSRPSVRCCETPEFYEEHGCPHGRDPKEKK